MDRRKPIRIPLRWVWLVVVLTAAGLGAWLYDYRISREEEIARMLRAALQQYQFEAETEA
jgi:hypothetical protein